MKLPAPLPVRRADRWVAA